MNNVEDVYELSPMQSGMLFDGLAADNHGMYRIFSAFHLHGDLDISVFHRAWRETVKRHPVLRTSIHFEGLEKPLQVVHREVDPPLELIDLQQVPAAEQDARVRQYVADEHARPMNLGAPPLMKLALFTTGPRSRWFLWTIHHILAEGWSLSIILGDVLKTYEALRQDRAPVLTPVRPYRDFILWMQQQNPAQAEAFWRQQLQGFAVPTPLPAGQGNPRLNSAIEAGRGQKVELSVAATTALEEFARAHKLTLSTLMRAAWAYLLSRYSGERDVLFGAMVSGRSIPLEGAESMVGLFVNLVPVRTQVAAEEPMLAWLQAIHAQQGAMSQYEFCGMTQIKRWSEVTGSLPLFETLMIYENWAGDVKDWQGIVQVQDFWGGQNGQGYPLTLVIEPGKQLAISALYDERRLTPAAVTRLLQYLRLVLEHLPANVRGRVQELPRLTPEEQQQLLVHWSGGASAGSSATPVHRLIDAQATRTPQAVAVVSVDGQLTYRELNDRANQLARHLQSVGVGPEVIVGVCLDRSPDLIVTLLAVHKAGGAYLPLDPKYPAERLAFMLHDAGVKVIVGNQATHGALPGVDANVVLIDRDREIIAAQPTLAPTVDAGIESLAYVIYTSGSTGTPKGVMIEQRSLASFVGAAIDAYAIEPSDRVLQFATVNFDAAVEEIFPCLVRGATLVLRTEAMLYSVGEFLNRCREWSISVLDLPTAFWHELVDALDAQALALPPCLRLVIIGGEAVLPERLATWRRCVGAHPRLLNTYGPTETTVVATVHDLSAPAEPDVYGEAVPIGRPLGAARVYILDDRRQPVPIGATGELYIGGAGLARGYLGRDELTVERFVQAAFGAPQAERLYQTGDRVRYRADGVLEYRGRTDQQIKLRGHRIELGEIEAAMARDSAVRDVVVLFRDDLDAPPGLVAYVVPREGSALTVEALRTALGERLPQYMVPAVFLLLDALPLLPNGKLDRRRLPVLDGQNLEPVAAEPQTETERAIAAIWREVLGLKRVGIHDNFFDLGGHSLLLMKMHGMLAKKFLRDLSFIELFEHTTIHGLARLLGPESTPTDDELRADDRDGKRQAGQQRLQARRARLTSTP
jgi:amino acid adenylation domain-containing protein